MVAMAIQAELELAKQVLVLATRTEQKVELIARLFPSARSQSLARLAHVLTGAQAIEHLGVEDWRLLHPRSHGHAVLSELQVEGS